MTRIVTPLHEEELGTPELRSFTVSTPFLRKKAARISGVTDDENALCINIITLVYLTLSHTESNLKNDCIRRHEQSTYARPKLGCDIIISGLE